MGRATALYHMVAAFEALGDTAKAIDHLKEVVQIDEKFDLPKLNENRARLKRLQNTL